MSAISPTTQSRLKPVQWRPALAAGAIALALATAIFQTDTTKGVLFLIGLALGISLLHATFGFTGAYRRALVDKDMSGITAQLVMIAVAMLLFAPVFSAGQVFGHGVSGAIAPVNVSLVVGALIFGIGMQLGGGCASGTLFAAGGGSVRMIIVLIFFCAGSFLASFDIQWWARLPGIGSISLAKELGRWQAVALQLVMLGAIYAAIYMLGCRNKAPLWRRGFDWRHLLRGPWPLLLGALALALLNWATLVTAGHPWSITWGFTLWAAKTAAMFGWDPSTSGFWSGGLPQRALHAPLVRDTTSVMNVGIIAGAFGAAALAGRLQPTWRIPLRSLAAAVIGGLMLGYGARLAYGCNIGAFFSGVASTSLHGWVWIAVAIIGNVIGIRFRRPFRLDG